MIHHHPRIDHQPATEALAEQAAIRRSQAIVELGIDGTILAANERFLKIVGYAADELLGRHHRILVEEEHAESQNYTNFWNSLAAGEFIMAEFKRLRKDGRVVWIQGSYNPVLDDHGRPYKIVKFSTDITAEKLKSADDAGQIEAIGHSQAVISFALDGTILDCNALFCRAVGYERSEIQGRHHSMFVDPVEVRDPEYQAFWNRLRNGRSLAGEYCRIGHDGRKVWLHATYTPILDPDGRPFKIVKYATDVTQAKLKNAMMPGKSRPSDVRRR